MNRKRLIYGLIALLIFCGLFVLYLNSTKNNSDVDVIKPPEYVSTNWKKTLSLKDKNPYGLFVFQELIMSEGRFKEFNTYTDYNLLDSLIQLDSSLIMFVGKNFILTQKEVDILLSSIYNGNDLFLSVDEPPYYLLSDLFTNHPLTFIPTKKGKHEINQTTYDQYYFYENDTLTEIWKVFLPEVLGRNAESLAFLNNYPNYIKISYGKGFIYLHLNPIVFTNFELLREEGKSYFKEVLSTLERPNIQWLEFANYVPRVYDPNASEYPPDPSVLTELFKHPSFRWGFIAAVFGVILYFLFRSKRRRPIIPAVENTKNTGFSYVDTLAGIYFNNRQANAILKLMKQNLYSAVFNHFYVDLSKEDNHEEIKVLSRKANVEVKNIEELLKRLEKPEPIKNTDLSDAYNLQRQFYFTSGIWNVEAKEQKQDVQQFIYHKKQSGLSLAITGLLIFSFGFYLLSIPISVGVLLWPIGGFSIIIGLRMLSHPYLLIKKDALQINSFLGKSREVSFEKIKFIKEHPEEWILHLDNGEELKISKSQLEEKGLRSINDFIKQFK